MRNRRCYTKAFMPTRRILCPASVPAAFSVPSQVRVSMASLLTSLADLRSIRLWQDVLPQEALLARLTLDQGVPAVSTLLVFGMADTGPRGPRGEFISMLVFVSEQLRRRGADAHEIGGAS